MRFTTVCIAAAFPTPVGFPAIADRAVSIAERAAHEVRLAEQCLLHADQRGLFRREQTFQQRPAAHPPIGAARVGVRQASTDVETPDMEIRCGDGSDKRAVCH